MSVYARRIGMSTLDRDSNTKEPGRTHIQDLSSEGYRLSDEELKLVSGGNSPAPSHWTKPLIDDDPTGDTTNLGQKFLD
jgi:hypothetical protein